MNSEFSMPGKPQCVVSTHFITSVPFDEKERDAVNFDFKEADTTAEMQKVLVVTVLSQGQLN